MNLNCTFVQVFLCFSVFFYLIPQISYCELVWDFDIIISKIIRSLANTNALTDPYFKKNNPQVNQERSSSKGKNKHN